MVRVRPTESHTGYLVTVPESVLQSSYPDLLAAFTTRASRMRSQPPTPVRASTGAAAAAAAASLSPAGRSPAAGGVAAATTTTSTSRPQRSSAGSGDAYNPIVLD